MARASWSAPSPANIPDASEREPERGARSGCVAQSDVSGPWTRRLSSATAASPLHRPAERRGRRCGATSDTRRCLNWQKNIQQMPGGTETGRLRRQTPPPHVQPPLRRAKTRGGMVLQPKSARGRLIGANPVNTSKNYKNPRPTHFRAILPTDSSPSPTSSATSRQASASDSSLTANSSVPRHRTT